MHSTVLLPLHTPAPPSLKSTELAELTEQGQEEGTQAAGLRGMVVSVPSEPWSAPALYPDQRARASS